MKQLFTFILILFIVLNSKSQNSISQLAIGEVHSFHSEILTEQRILNVFLPEKYDSAKTYPVIYLLDGSYNEDFLHIVGLVQFFNMQFKMPETIVVGIANVDRKRDFTHHTELEDLKTSFPTAGHSAAFIEFMEKEVKPYVNQHFKTNETNYLIGQSLGGLVASEILLKKPELFSHYLIVSPSLWWDNESMLNQANELIQKHTDDKRFIYLSVGEKEHPIMVKDAIQLSKIILKNKKSNTQIIFNKMKKEDHATILHNSIYEAFLHLFPIQH